MEFVKEFPDPFLMNSGNRVQSVEDWDVRRKEILDLVMNVEYGTMPGTPEKIQVDVIENSEVDGELFYQKLRLTFIPHLHHPEVSFGMNISIRYPFSDCIEDRREEIPDFGKKGLPCMIYVGNASSLELNDAGYLIIGFENDQLDPMEMGNPIVGPAQAAYEQLFPGKYSWGSISVWAWGAMRVMDYALTRDDIAKDKILISGHSRNGKTALLAGALDERFSLVCPAGSGCAGAGAHLAFGEGSETIASLTDRRRWWAWTHKDFEQYAYEFRNDNKKKLPFDQHFVMGLVAPRPLLRTDGTEDYWANPEGTSCAFLATEPIYDFLGVPDFNQSFLRPGGHHQGHEDMMALLSFADWQFYGVPQERVFKDLVYEKDKFPKLFSWEKPN